MTVPPVDLVRRAIERAIEIARAGESARPPEPAPVALRPVLQFKRLPARARVTVAHVLDTDAEFRARVAAAVDRDEVGRVAWLWLSRPAGWQDELTQLVEELEVDVVPPPQEREADKALRRRVEGAERAAARALEHAERLETELERTRRELADSRDARSALDTHVADLERRVDGLAAERSAAVADLKRVESILARRTDEKRGLERRITELQAVGPSSAAPPPGEPDDQPELRALQHLVERIALRSAALTDDVDAVRAALGMTRSDPQPDARPEPRRREQSPRRRPAPIPGGLRSDSLEAATHLLTRPGAVLLVDGYNISMWAWPELEIVEQRARLERALGDLAARTPGLAIDLVFDGAEVLPLSRTGARRARGITVRFTPADIEADDALLELVDRYPHARPVIVASDDRRVRDGARQRGANVVAARQLIGVART